MKYEIFPAFAHGGMASVHVGRLRGPSGFKKVFAVKQLNPIFATSERHTRMLFEEAHLTARIRSPYVVPVIELVHEGDLLCIVMELVIGTSLATLLASAAAANTRMPPAVASSILCDALRGLHAAHETTDAEGRPLAIVHRDVSPQNILVGVDGIARVLDFGIARALGREPLSVTGEVQGKFAYMAPEQLRASAVTRQADVYAAGVVLWEALVGERLRNAAEPAAIVASLLDPVPAPSSRVPSLPRGIDSVVAEALASEDRRRFPSAEAMAFALEEACPPASRDEVARFVERVAFDEVDRLTSAVRSAERHVSVATEAPGTQPRVATGQFRRGALVGSVVAGAAAALALGLLLPLRTRGAAAAPAPTNDLRAESPPPAVSVSSSPSSAVPPVVGSSTPPLRPAPARGGGASRRASSGSTSSSCSPAYEFDDRGNKHYKPQCIP